MYQGIAKSVVKTALVTATTATGSAVVLPHTVANPLGIILAYVAVGIGSAVLLSQFMVRVLRRIYR